MNIIVLLSAGRHPASGMPRPVPVELQAIALARALSGAEVAGLHAGGRDEAVLDALGHGLDLITIIEANADDDPLARLAPALAARAPDLILAGRRGMGGADTGLLPYRIARKLDMPIVADAVAVDPGPDRCLTVTQALPRGGRRAAMVHGPAVLTVHPSATAALPYTYRARLAGTVDIGVAPGIVPDAAPRTDELEIRPYRARPKLIGEGTVGGSAEARLRAVSETRVADGKLMIQPSPEEAADAILDYVARFRPATLTSAGGTGGAEREQ